MSVVSRLLFKLKRPKPTKQLRYVGREWFAAPFGGDCILWLVAEPEHMKGRLLLARRDGVWECGRDGSVDPKACIEASPDLWRRFQAD